MYKAVADSGFSPGGAPTPQVGVRTYFLAENCMKMKEFRPPGGGGASLAALLRSATAKYFQLKPCNPLCVVAQRPDLKQWNFPIENCNLRPHMAIVKYWSASEL